MLGAQVWDQAARAAPGARVDWPANSWPAQPHQQPFQHQQQQAIPAPVAASAARPRLPLPPPLPPAPALALAGGQQHAALANEGYAACQPDHADPLASGSSLYNGRLAGAVAHKPAASAAAAAEALRACRRLNGRIKQASTPQELFEVLRGGWAALDVANLSSALHRLSRLAEAAPGGVHAWCRAHLLGSPVWAWLLDNLQPAASSPDFGPQAVANTLAALVRLDALSPALLEALHPPLERALHLTATGASDGQSAAGGGFTSQGLSQVCWALGREPAARPLLLAVKPALFQALTAAAPTLDAQGVAAAWYGLGEAAAYCLAGELDLWAEAPALLQRLAAAARAAAPAMALQGVAQVLNACTKVRPRPYRDEALMQALAVAAVHRLHTGQEAEPAPAAVGAIVAALGRLGFLPRCHWDPSCGEQRAWVQPLDELGAALAQALPRARPQDVSAFLSGTGQLRYAPPAPVLRALLAHLASNTAGAALQTGGGDSMGSGSGGGGGGDGGGGEAGSGGVDGRRLVLEAYTSQELSDLACSLRRILKHGCYPASLLPPAAVAEFVDAFDTLLGARAKLARKVAGSPKLRAAPRRAELALAPQHVGSICWALAGVPGANLTAFTLRQLEKHLCAFAPSYSASALANLLHCYATHGLALGAEAAGAACTRARAIAQPSQLAAAGREPGMTAPLQPLAPGFTLGSLARLLSALAMLKLHRPGLLHEALLPSAAAALRAAEQAASLPGAGPSEGVLREAVMLAAALGQLAAAGQLGRLMEDRIAVPPLWLQLGQLLERCALAAGSGGLQRGDAAAVVEAASQLDAALGCRACALPPSVAYATRSG